MCFYDVKLAWTGVVNNSGLSACCAMRLMLLLVASFIASTTIGQTVMIPQQTIKQRSARGPPIMKSPHKCAGLPKTMTKMRLTSATSLSPPWARHRTPQKNEGLMNSAYQCNMLNLKVSVFACLPCDCCAQAAHSGTRFARRTGASPR